MKILLKILENCKESYLLILTKIIRKLIVSESVKCEVFNVEFLSRDLSLSSSAIMVKWKCLKLLYLSKGMCRTDNQLKNWYVWSI